MSTVQTVLLGTIAGSTIFLGLPLGRMRNTGTGLRCFLNGVSAGILVFLLFDILEHAVAPLDEAVTEAAWGHLAGVAALFVGGFGLGLLGLLYVGKLTRRPTKVS